MYIDVKPGDTIEDFGAFLYQLTDRKRCRNFNLDSVELGDIPEDRKDKLTDDDAKGKFKSTVALLFV